MKCFQKKRLTSLIIAALSVTAMAVFGCSGPHQGKDHSKGKTSVRDSIMKALDWQIGMQAWSLRNLTFFEIVDTIKNMGLHYIEAFPQQKIGGGLDGEMSYKMDSSTQKAIRAYLESKDIKLMAYGVVVPQTTEEWRQLFAFAKSMGIQNIVTDPNPKFLGLIAQLCNQYEDIRVCVHNNPLPGRHSRNPDTVLADILRVGNGRFGACADVGNWVRAGYDPVQSLKKLQGHVMEVHMKDLLGTAVNSEDTVWGSGNCNIKGVLEELNRQQFKGLISIECESHPGENIPEMKKNMVFFYKTIATFK
ncbi:MAG TPA: sugar phosphate isomerase/epimerase [Chitinophagaceae bacterium]|nr:sugar phosphate isomerase/epimerase [Chitinophagaceae bacterium]